MDVRSVLLVDDESVVRMTTALILKKLGISVTSFDNGTEAIRCYQENPDGFDLVIMDSHMPEMNGLELFRELKKLKPDIKAVLASGFMDDDEQLEFQSEGFYAFLTKPFSIQELKTLLEHL